MVLMARCLSALIAWAAVTDLLHPYNLLLFCISCCSILRLFLLLLAMTASAYLHNACEMGIGSVITEQHKKLDVPVAGDLLQVACLNAQACSGQINFDSVIDA